MFLEDIDMKTDKHDKTLTEKSCLFLNAYIAYYCLLQAALHRHNLIALSLLQKYVSVKTEPRLILTLTREFCPSWATNCFRVTHLHCQLKKMSQVWRSSWLISDESVRSVLNQPWLWFCLKKKKLLHCFINEPDESVQYIIIIWGGTRILD